MSGQIAGVSNTVKDLENEWHQLLSKEDADIGECLKMIHRLQHSLVAFETRVRDHRDRITIKKLADLEGHVRNIGFNIAETLFKAPNIS